MTRHDGPTGRRSRSETRCVVWAVCEFPGELPVRLPATEISLVGAKILAMKTPAIGTALRLVLCPPGGDAQLVVAARVIAARLDPAAPELCYFEVVFGDLDDAVVERLEALCSTPPPRVLQKRAHASPGERREYPRVDAELRALLELDGGSQTLGVKNISMSGALLEATLEPLPSGVGPGAVMDLTLFDSNGSESVTVTALVIRIDATGPAPSVAVRFLRVDDHRARRLEGLIVYALVKSGWPDLYQPPAWPSAPEGPAPDAVH
jgi:hypothetical protein